MKLFYCTVLSILLLHPLSQIKILPSILCFKTLIVHSSLSVAAEVPIPKTMGEVILLCSII